MSRRWDEYKAKHPMEVRKMRAECKYLRLVKRGEGPKPREEIIVTHKKTPWYKPLQKRLGNFLLKARDFFGRRK